MYETLDKAMPPKTLGLTSAPKRHLYRFVTEQLIGLARANEGRVSRSVAVQVVRNARETYPLSALVDTEDGRLAADAAEMLTGDQFDGQTVDTLVRSGWLRRARGADFEPMYVVALPALEILNWFEGVEKRYGRDVTGLIISVYDGLEAAVRTEANRAARIRMAAENSARMVHALQELGGRLGEFQHLANPKQMGNALLSELLDRYDVDVYRRINALMTVENASRYRPEIRRLVRALEKPGVLREAALHDVSAEAEGVDAREMKLRESLDLVLEDLKRLDREMDELQRLNLAVWEMLHQAAELHGLRTLTPRGMVQELLRVVVEGEDRVPDEVITLRLPQRLEGRSLTRPRRRGSGFTPAPSPPPVLSEEDREALQREALESMADEFGRERVEAYLATMFAGRATVRASELHSFPADAERVVTGILELAGSGVYAPELMQDAPWVLAGRVLFRDFYIHDLKHPAQGLIEEVRRAA